MSEQKNDQPKAQGEQLQQKRQTCWQWKVQHSNESTKKKDAEAIPILRYGPSNHFVKFKEAISKAVLTQYGDLGRLIHQGSYFIPPEPDRAINDLSTNNQPIKMRMALMRNDMPMRHGRQTCSVLTLKNKSTLSDIAVSERLKCCWITRQILALCDQACYVLSNRLRKQYV
jgi:hypothetical protein